MMSHPLLDAPRVGTHTRMGLFMDNRLEPGTPPQPTKPMGRGAQTALIIGAMFAMFGGYVVYDHIANPNLDGLSAEQRCEYWAWNKNHGGDEQTCKDNEVAAARYRIEADHEYRY